MKVNIAKLAKVLVRLVVAAPAIVSAIKPIAKAITGTKRVPPAGDAAARGSPPSV